MVLLIDEGVLVVDIGLSTHTRHLTDRHVLDHLSGHAPLSRTELKSRTGLSQPTVLEAVNRLLDAGMVVEAGRGAGGRRGPSAQLYDIDARCRVAAGASVSASDVELAIVDLRGTVIAQRRQPFDPDESASQVSDVVIDLIRSAGIDAERLAHVVVGTHGQIERRTGDLGFAWDLPHWEHATLETLRAALPCPVTLERDVELAAAAEHVAGSTQGLTNFGVLWIGMGLGYTSHIDGAVLRGSTGAAGQIGYMPTPGAQSPPLPTRHDHTVGYHGGLQSLIGSEALHALAAELEVDAPLSALSRPSALLDAYAPRVALGLATVTALIDPGTITLSGEVGHAGGDALATAVAAHLAQIAPTECRVVAGHFGGDGVLRGALELAAREARDATWGAAAR
ncbi:MAG: ROK family transcriptional regulator [Brachybacterium sp.]|nr:ROK family transcriptional regulator [Brachybacterium sp.]